MKYVKPSILFRDLLKRDELKHSRLLGLDVGDKYVGLAVSDPDNKIASPLRYFVHDGVLCEGLGVMGLKLELTKLDQC